LERVRNISLFNSAYTGSETDPAYYLKDILSLAPEG
jgi:hypothetical protein